MKHLRLSAKLGVLSLVAAVASVILLHPHKAIAQDSQGNGNGATYLTTATDSTGKFVARGVITLHADHTVAVVDSNSGGPQSFFSGELGSWKPDANGGVAATAIDFDFPPNQDVARIDYALKFESNGRQISGTSTVTIFPFQGNPFDGGGTVVGTFNLTGVLVKP